MADNKLTPLLEKIANLAKQKPGDIQRLPLNKGLVIYMMAENEKLKLSLARSGTFPSQSEWDTITKYLPGGPLFLDPKKRQQGNRYFLVAEWMPDTGGLK